MSHYRYEKLPVEQYDEKNPTHKHKVHKNVAYTYTQVTCNAKDANELKDILTVQSPAVKTTKKAKTTEESPLDVPGLNFGEKKTPEKDAILDLPAMDFSTVSHTEDQQEVKAHTVGEEETEILDTPQW